MTLMMEMTPWSYPNEKPPREATSAAEKMYGLLTMPATPPGPKTGAVEGDGGGEAEVVVGGGPGGACSACSVLPPLARPDLVDVVEADALETDGARRAMAVVVVVVVVSVLGVVSVVVVVVV
jgi:hypothetical protein